MMKFLLKYFYSWFILPLIIFHELTHCFVALVLGIKIKSIKLYKTSIYLYNFTISFEYKPSKWKWYLISYSPYLMLIVLFMFIFINIKVFFILLLYYLMSIIYDGKNSIIIFLPSKADKYSVYKNKYYQYLIDNVSSDIFFSNLRDGTIDELVEKYHLLNEIEYVHAIKKYKSLK